MPARAALVTGASSGIGLAIARALGEDAYGVTLCARGTDRLEAAAAGLRAGGIDAHAIRADMASERDIEALVAGHRRRFGRMDVLVNNAGIGQRTSIEGHDTAALDEQLAVNLRAVILTMRASIPLLRKAGAEHRKALVANVSSIAGKRPQVIYPSYSAAKAGVIALSAAAHHELARDGIQVTALCPSYVATPMTDAVGVPKEEMLTPEDLAEAVRFLLRTSPACMVPELQMGRRGVLGGARP